MGDENQNANATTTPAPAPDAAQLQRELINERFEAVAAKHGLDDALIPFVAPAAHAWLEKNGRAGSKQDMADYFAELKKSAPKFFASSPAPAASPGSAPAAPANTAPVVRGAQPTAPAPSALNTPYQQWRALKAAGRNAEAQAFYRMNRSAISRSA